MVYHKYKSILFLSLLLAFLCYCCQNLDEESVILLSPPELFISTQATKVVSITANCSSPTDLTRLTVTSQIEGSFSEKKLDTLISGKKFYLKFEYLIPDLIDSTNIIIEFVLKDISGKVVNNMKVLKVIPFAKNLTETSGNEMFSGRSGKQNAYNLIDGVPLFSYLADSSKMHIVDSTSSMNLSRRWISPPKVKFVRFNGFDYPNCTNISVRNAFNAGIKTDFVDNLNQGDIILAKIIYQKVKEYYVAIKLVSIIDNPGTDWDRYIFNFKK